MTIEKNNHADLRVQLELKVISHLCCTYDNPATMARECWRDGKLLCKYNAELFFLPVFPVPPVKFFFGANIGKWVTGQMVGDAGAMTYNVQAKPQTTAANDHG